MPFCHSELRALRPKSNRYPKEISTLGDHIRSRRLDLKLLQRQVAEQSGVDEITITNWERNATTPAIRYTPAIIQFLGYEPQSAADSLPQRLATERTALGLSQRTMAERLVLIRAPYRVGKRGDISPPEGVWS